MIIKLMESDKEVFAKRYNELTEEELLETTTNRSLWDGDEVFIKTEDGMLNEWSYLYEREFTIIEE
jgi:hypothetical protein